MQKDKPKQAKKTNQKSAFEESIAAALKSTSQKRHNPSLPVSMSETDAIRKHFQPCWNVPAGAKDAEDMVVELEIRFQQDGTVRSVQVLDPCACGTILFSNFGGGCAKSGLHQMQ